MTDGSLATVTISIANYVAVRIPAICSQIKVTKVLIFLPFYHVLQMEQ